ncbi:hypothetical protein RchiOBHm_Chr6g0287921 [Rosa chinensis]|uniref:Uncharacterized protein n=1 Tax=Rosa chinensis TaxID=74649 RepID=A0A2P6PV85_ROSCH|nr:hypothetical protein RchiOBHm_Chr6g0287921 [Rosa chinensis]
MNSSIIETVSLAPPAPLIARSFWSKGPIIHPQIWFRCGRNGASVQNRKSNVLATTNREYVTI